MSRLTHGVVACANPEGRPHEGDPWAAMVAMPQARRVPPDLPRVCDVCHVLCLVPGGFESS